MHNSIVIQPSGGLLGDRADGDRAEFESGLAGDELPLLLNVQQAAALLSISKTTLYGLVWHGEIERVHIGRAVRYPRVSLERYVDRLIEESHGS